jgi:tetratricopeptide (TPR) repeat protein
MSPDALDAYLYKAKINRYIQSAESLKTMAEAYDKYIELVTAKGDAEIAKQKKNLIDAYSNAGAYYAVINKAKAIEYFNKALALDPSDDYVKNELKRLK